MGATTRSEGGTPGRMVRSQEPKEFQASALGPYKRADGGVFVVSAVWCESPPSIDYWRVLPIN